ncbi:Iron compound ABC transporter, permease protein [Ketogulonicigenium vulgare]|uniref:Iron compound ABC transporter, permease protein n=1 Tax=Ketogulonicigenium vulgare (strain WSH-001) TaxID=759362 RepID=F9Y9B8_KETVW|nr:iron ABC transporter permease [Ketogulonicigenium vulgare]AEM40100.1 Iron compound ABC transporter, permease protein [Ketogulonicigenium vulgare WSH-001]ALJ80307.1 ABC transporter permease [Ketogulonicigenium vulgare]AOZ53796.1 Iron compound ABC transporter, permease protein [Ketogulonicigenium vulgare]
MRYPLLLSLLAALVALLFVASLLIGPAGISVSDSLAALFTGGAQAEVLVMREIRLPRTLLAAMIGAALGLAGAAVQGWLRNPLAEPGLLGTSATAALGAVIVLQTGLAGAIGFLLPMAALAGALLSVLLVLVLSGPRGQTLTIILAGVAISALAGAGVSLALNLSPNPYAAYETMFWLMGAVADRSMAHVALAAPLLMVGAVLIALTARGLDALTLGEDAASAMGIDLTRLRILLVLGLAALVGGATAVAGAIGFVGLVVPHVLRRAVGGRPSRLLGASALGGAALLLAADIAIRLIAPDRDLKLGVITALIGAPLFLHLIWKLRREAL